MTLGRVLGPQGVAVPTVPLRERHLQATRHTIEAAGMQLFAERGFDGTTVDDIAEHAGVSQRTVFRYFPTKRSILMEYEHTMSQQLRDLTRDQPPSELTIGSIGNVLVAFADIFEHDRETVAQRCVIIESSADLVTYMLEVREMYTSVMADELDRLRRAKVGKADTRILARLAEIVLTEAMSEWREGGFSKSLPKLVRNVVDRVRVAGAQ
jgi:AcrR family transcriptional regulator